jgi:hypothetical protein
LGYGAAPVLGVGRVSFRYWVCCNIVIHGVIIAKPNNSQGCIFSRPQRLRVLMPSSVSIQHMPTVPLLRPTSLQPIHWLLCTGHFQFLLFVFSCICSSGSSYRSCSSLPNSVNVVVFACPSASPPPPRSYK